MSKRKWRHSGLRTSWRIVRLVSRIADWMDDLHDYLLRAMFDNCTDCGMEDGHSHRDGCQFAPPHTIARGRVVQVSTRPPLTLPEDEEA